MLSPELALEMRRARPTASPELRQRVLALAAVEAPPRREAARPLTERGRAPNAVDKLGRFQPPPRRALRQQHGTFATGAVPTVPSRLQQYNAALRVQVR